MYVASAELTVDDLDTLVEPDELEDGTLEFLELFHPEPRLGFAPPVFLNLLGLGGDLHLGRRRAPRGRRGCGHISLGLYALAPLSDLLGVTRLAWSLPGGAHFASSYETWDYGNF